MSEEDKKAILEKLAAECPLMGEAMKIAAEGVREFRDVMVAQGITGTINGVPFGKRKEDLIQTLPEPVETSEQSGERGEG